MTRYEEKDKDRKVAISQYKSHFRVRLDASMLEARRPRKIAMAGERMEFKKTRYKHLDP